MVVTSFWDNLELHEAAYWSDYYKAATPETARACGLQVANVGSAHIMLASKVDILAFNRVVGFGMHEPAAEAQLDEIIDIVLRAGVPRFFLQLSPHARPEQATAWLRRRGFTHHNNWMKLIRQAGPAPAVETELQIVPAGVRQAQIFADIIVRSFEWPEMVSPVVASTVGRPGWRHYLALRQQQPVACAACYHAGDFAALTFAATLPEFRGLGAQSALIARRLQDCSELGCKWITVETAEEREDRPVPSYRNLRKFGFRVVYRRPNFIRIQPACAQAIS